MHGKVSILLVILHLEVLMLHDLNLNIRCDRRKVATSSLSVKLTRGHDQKFTVQN